MKSRHAISLAAILIVPILTYTQITFFIIPPIGALPNGKTIVITRLNKTEFIDSPDALCERIQDGVSLLCRAMAMSSVLGNSKILLRLPYSSLLYSISTKGKSYER